MLYQCVNRGKQDRALVAFTWDREKIFTESMKVVSICPNKSNQRLAQVMEWIASAMAPDGGEINIVVFYIQQASVDVV